MKTLATSLGLASLFLVLVTAGLGCGGGSDPSPTTPPLTPTQMHTGAYFYQAFWGNYGGPSAATWWGDYVADGAGMITGGTLIVNNAGATATAPVVPLPYTVDANHRMVWSPAMPGEHTGGLAADGRAAVLCSTANTSFPALAVALRRSGAFTTGSLVGTYHVVGFWRAGLAVASIWGTASFNGAGGVTWTLTRNFGGAVAPAVYAPSAYAVAADGTVDIALGAAMLRGGMLEGRELVAVTGTTAPAAPNLMMLLMPQATSTSLATLTGPYHLVAIGLDLGGPPYYVTLTGPATADGAGMLTLLAGAVRHVDAAVAPTVANSVNAYTVLPNGEFGMGSLTGAVGQSGAYAFLGGRTTNLSAPEMWVLLR